MILLLFLSACAGRRADYPERLQRASQLVEVCPDSALGYLDSLGVPLSGLPEEARMYAQLLRIKARLISIRAVCTATCRMRPVR